MSAGTLNSENESLRHVMVNRLVDDHAARVLRCGPRRRRRRESLPASYVRQMMYKLSRK